MSALQQSTEFTVSLSSAYEPIYKTTDFFQRLTIQSCYTNLEQTPSTTTGVLQMNLDFRKIVRFSFPAWSSTCRQV